MRLAILSLALLVLASCVEKKSGPKIDPAYVEANLLAEAPATLSNRVDADLGGKVVYLGNEVDTEVLTPGGAAKVVHYWKVIEAPGSEWRVFSHLVGAGDQWMNLDATDMRRGYPPSKWKAGDVIRDEQKFTLDAGWKGSTATLTVGLYRQGGQGAAARMPIVTGAKDAEGRVIAATLKVDGKGAAAGKKTEYVVRRAAGPIAIDGRADEEAWKKAPRSPDFSAAEGGKAMPVTTSARLLWDDQHLYAFIEAADRDVFSQYTKHDDPLWKEDVVELFIDADGNRRGYVELQVNPNNAHFDAWFPQTRSQKSHFEWNADMKSAVVVRGSADDRDDEDEGWDVEIAIPLAAVKGMDAAMAVTLPPAVGDSWRLNVVRIEKPADESLAAASWNPIPIRDFHALDRMLTVVFGDETGATEAATSTAPEEGAEEAGAEAGATATEPRTKAIPHGLGGHQLSREAVEKRRATAAEREPVPEPGSAAAKRARFPRAPQ